MGDSGFDQSKPLNWAPNSVGQCPYYDQKTTMVEPLMSYLKQDTPEGRMGIYWSGVLGASQGALYLGPSAVENNPHYSSGPVATSVLGENGYFNIQITQFAYKGTVSPVYASWNTIMILDTGTPILMVPQNIYNAMVQGDGGSELTVELEAVNGGNPVSLKFSADVLLKNNWISSSYNQFILGLPVWAFY